MNTYESDRERELRNMFVIEEELKLLPKKPGVYIMHDAKDNVIYVGKAINLYNRVRSYFRPNVGRGPWIDKMISLIARFEYIVTDSELEALVLENNLIKEYSPKYNTLLKDDKTYPYIKATVSETYPRLLFSREMKKDKSKYFGPYTNGTAVKETIDFLNKLFQLRSCNRVLPRDAGKDRPCLNHHMNQCEAPCRGCVDPIAYQQRFNEACEFLNGNVSRITKDIQQKMYAASEKMEFEEAMKYRDLLENINAIQQKQKITDSSGEDKDIIALDKEEDEAVVQVFFVRNGKLIGREHFYMKNVRDQEKPQILNEFVKQFYTGTPFIPREIMLQYEIEDRETISGWFSKIKGSKVNMVVPQRGQKEKLIELAAQNARLVLSRDLEKIKREEARTIGAVREIAELLNLPGLSRMEAFDISNTSGFANVGSMVVFEKGKPKKSDYRKFRMQTVTGPDDYACMHEVLTRRFSHGLEQQRRHEAGEEIMFDSFARFPDLLLMDGGRGQVNIALQVLEELQIHIPVCGMVKDDHHNTRGLFYNNVELPIDTRSDGFQLITRIQDEAHRFAIEYHRSLRAKGQVHSILDDIPGVGPVRKKALMRTFQSIDALREASVPQLKDAMECSETVAQNVYDFLHAPIQV